MKSRSGSPSLPGHDVGVPHLLAQGRWGFGHRGRAGSLGGGAVARCRARPCLTVSHIETMISSRGTEGKRCRRARQVGGDRRAPWPTGRSPWPTWWRPPASAAPTAHRLAVRPGRPRPGPPRPTTAASPSGADLVGLGHAAADGWPWGEAAGPALVALRRGDRRERPALRARGRRPAVPGGAGVGPRAAHDRARGRPPRPRRRLGRARLLARRRRQAMGRRGGWVESVEERAPGVASVSAPVRDRAGRGRRRGRRQRPGRAHQPAPGLPLRRGGRRRGPPHRGRPSPLSPGAPSARGGRHGHDPHGHDRLVGDEDLQRGRLAVGGVDPLALALDVAG